MPGIIKVLFYHLLIIGNTLADLKKYEEAIVCYD